ncbi:MAG: hypothetical protein ACOC0U_04425, partial [Desulfovibrionales bacterium]
MRRLLRIILLVLFCALAGGCAVKEPTVAPIPEGTQESRADTAWRLRNFTMSEKLYRELLTRREIPESRSAEAWERLVLSAVYAGHPEDALTYLKNWETAQPDADQSWAYHQGYVQANLQMNMPASARNHLVETVNEPTYPESVRVRAGRALSELYWQRKELMDALDVYEKIYRLCSDRECRTELERELWDRLGGVDRKILEALSRPTAGQKSAVFPENLLEWHINLKRLRQDPSSWDRVWTDLQSLFEEGQWADKEFIRGILERLEARYGHPTERGIALLLPLSGPYGNVGWKIVKGAELARDRLASFGVDVSIRIINSESSDWIEQLRELPSTYSVVGGPLR